MEDEFELSLELSIGGCYGKPDHRKNIEAKTSEPLGSDFSSGEIELASKNGSEFVDLQRRKEIHALRRREARMKREVKKSKALNNVSLTLVEDKLILEGEQFQTRVREREIREVGEIPEDSARETEGASISGDNYASRQMQAQFLLPQVQYLPIGNGFAYPCVVPSWRPNSVEEERNAVRPVMNLNSPVDLCSGNGSREAASTRSVGRSSSVVSDHRSSLKKGGSSSETGSHSSIFGTHQNQCVSTSDNIEHLEADGSSSHVEPGLFVGQLNPDQTTNPGSSSIQQLKSSPSKVAETQSDSTTETSGGMMKPPKPPTNNPNGASGLQMPCVSTTGNGPNGKTITGFLYKYSKSEVCIMCLCHRTSFSPAGFVEHAGGVDISHPLKHITVVSSTL